MLGEGLKNSIDRVWNVFWSNGMTNPLTVMEQITFLLFMKLLDDNQTTQEANSSRLRTQLTDPIFSDGNKDLRWKNFHNLAPEVMLKHVTEKVFPFVTQIGSGRNSAFSRYMADAQFQIVSAKVLSVAVAEIDQMDLHDRDVMGDVYEDLLEKVKSSGENGQFRSPTHIINMMVELIQPKIDDVVIDPAFGTAGFLVSVAKYVNKNYADELLQKKTRQHFKSAMFTGFDIDKQMLRIGAMNLMLHGVEAPDVRYNNSIAEDSDTPRGKYTLVLANPPFAGNMTEIEVARDLTSLAATKKTELLFVSLFTKLLKVGGRCAAIVPQGVLFGASNAHRAIRKELVEHQQLDAVITMPSGVFKPYSGVATAILIFHKTDNCGTDYVWFYNMENDGYSLDDKREPIADNDIPDVISKFRVHRKYYESQVDRFKKWFNVPRQEIAENGYDLSFNRYRKIARQVKKFAPSNEIVATVEDLAKEFNAKLEALKGML